MKPSTLARIATQFSQTSAIVDAVELRQARRNGSQREYVAPSDQFEESICEIWIRLLRVERVGRTDDFFQLGGHSLLATQMISRVWELFGVEVPLVEIFANPALDSFASIVRAAVSNGERAAQAPLAAAVRPDRLPLSYGQQRLWFLDQLEPGSSFYNVVLKWRLRGALNRTALEASLNEIVARHEVLRTVFAMDDGEPVQIIAPVQPITLSVVDLSDVAENVREEQVRVLVAEEARRPFDLQRGPVFRAELLKLSSEEHVLVFNTHHVAIDGWSFGVFRQELATLYEAFVAGRPSPLPPLPLQYADYSLWQRTHVQGESLERHLEYWKKHLLHAPPSIELPTDYVRPAVQTYRGASHVVVLPNGLVEGLKALGQKEGATLFMTALAAFYVLLSRYSGQEDIVVGSAIAGRVHGDTEKLIGLFVNTLALRTEVSGNLSFRELLRRVRETTVNAYAHQDVPFERLVEELNPVRDSSRSPLYQVMMILQNIPAQKTGISGLQISPFGSTDETSQMDLLLNLVERPSGLALTLTYNTDLFDGSTIERMLTHYQHLLEDVLEDATVRVSELSLLVAEEMERLVEEWNDTATDYPREKCLHDVIAAQTAARPDEIAIVSAGERLSYRELERRSNRLANYLRTSGIRRGDRVGVYLERSLDLMVTVLAVMKTGAAYVPLDTNYPVKRVQMILQDAEVSCLLTKTGLVDRVANHAPAVVLLDEEAGVIADRPSTAVASDVTPDDLLYVIFTSGSTGRPKGVEVSHRAVVNLLNCMATELGMGPNDVIPALASFGFDMSVPELYLALFTGGTLALAESHLAGSGEELARFLNMHGATVVHATPTTWGLLLDAGFTAAGLKRCIGAEPLPQGLFERLMAAAPGTPLWNFYGPTETTVWSSVHRFTSAKETIVIGHPLANTQIYILDRNGQVCPIGVTGEIHIAGDGVARGYRGRPDLTAEKFVRNPFVSDPDARMYKTADLGRWNADGTIEHLGRADHQVKIRGFRIELGEIEAVLAAQPGVREAVVIAREDEPGNKRLVAYVVSETEISHVELRSRLKETLPEYMIPAAFVALERMPLTPNGKVDRNNLPAPATYAQSVVGGHAPGTPMQLALAEIWKEVLKVSFVNIEDDFFQLGGHSLLATQMISRVWERLGARVPLVEIFANPTLDSFAKAAEAAVSGGETVAQTPLSRVVRPDRLPLSYGQQRLWFLDQLEPGSSFYNVPLKWRLRGVLDAAALEAALGEIVARHEVLRTTFVMDGGEPIQRIAPTLAFALSTTDLSAVSEDEREEQARFLVNEEARRPFDLQHGPVFRARLLKLSEEEHALVLNIHHVASDGWSLAVLRQELSALYEAFVAGRPSPLPPLPLQYADYAVWQRTYVEGGALEKQLEYWREHLLHAPPSIELPTDYVRPAVQTYRGASHVAVVPNELLEGLKVLGQKEGATLFMTLLAAFYVLLSRYSGQEDIVVGSAIAGRTHGDTEKLIGLFVNTLALRTEVSGNLSFRELLRRVRETTVSAYTHQDVPYERLVEDLNPVRDSSRSPLYQVMLILQNLPPHKAAMSGLQISPFGSTSETSQMDLLLNLVENPAGLTATLTYNPDLFDGSTIERMLAHYQHLLESVVEDAAVRVSEMSMLVAEEMECLVEEWNDTATDYPREKCLHAVIAQQAAALPSSVAVVFGSESLSYGELELDSNRLANYLRASGIRRGDRVGVYLERSLDLVVALLAVMKTGAAYVPLDTNYPVKRVQLILQDAEVSWVVTKATLRNKLDHTGPVVLLDKEAEAISNRLPTRLASDVTPDDLLYVIFTSGSTGRPKGVEVSHRAVVNLLNCMATELGMGPNDVIPALASFGFDMSVPELYLALFTGGTLALAESHLAGSGEDLARFLNVHGATVVHATPTTWGLLLDAGFTAAGLKRCIGAEPLPQGLFERLMAAAPGTPLWNFYGPTETTVWSSVHRFTSAKETIVIGHPLANTQIYILDRNGQVCPIGGTGEIHIAGDGVARGYRGRPDLTSEKFVRNPFASDPDARMYKTADLGRWNADGTIEHLGRADHQVKIRGFRIELGEIEAVLAAQPGVREAVVIAREDEPGNKRLVAYVVSETEISHVELRSRLKETLPEYMIPAAFVALERMPLTPNGKVDRNNLPAPQIHAHSESAGHAPSTRMEVLLAEIWKEVLQVPSVTVEDDFFHLGGHSLLAAAMIGKISETLGYRVRLSALFEAPTLGALAVVAKKQGVEQETLSAIVPIRKTGTKPILFCVSRPNVNALGFIFLSRAVSKSLPVYGLQSNMENDGVFAPFTQQEYEDKARDYIIAMREIQPEGPYFLTGYCEGAHIAFEMARQLEAMKLEVGSIFILDVWPVENTIDPRRFMLRNYGRVLRKFLDSSNRDRLAMISRKRYGLPAVPAKRPVVDGKLLRAPDSDLEARKHRSRDIAARYWPGKDFKATIYGGNIVVFRVSRQPFHRIRDKGLGWGARVLGKVDIVTVPGTHGEILRDPGVAVVARELELRIDRYLACKAVATESK